MTKPLINYSNRSWISLVIMVKQHLFIVMRWKFIRKCRCMHLVVDLLVTLVYGEIISKKFVLKLLVTFLWLLQNQLWLMLRILLEQFKLALHALCLYRLTLQFLLIHHIVQNLVNQAGRHCYRSPLRWHKLCTYGSFGKTGLSIIYMCS